MITKENLWFVTLFSLILILGVYYVTMPSDFLKSVTTSNNQEEVDTEVEEENILSVMRVNLEEERSEKIESLQTELTNSELTGDEKNNLYEELKYLNEVQGVEEKLEKIIKIDNTNVTTICVSDEHSLEIANNIMRLIQKQYDERMNITVKFQKH
jgi:hypothetical protein